MLSRLIHFRVADFAPHHHHLGQVVFRVNFLLADNFSLRLNHWTQLAGKLLERFVDDVAFSI